MSDSDINETGIHKGLIPPKRVVILGDTSGTLPVGWIPPHIPKVRSDDTDKKSGSSSKSSDAKKE